jgi:hypothetical protein
MGDFGVEVKTERRMREKLAAWLARIRSYADPRDSPTLSRFPSFVQTLSF